MTRSVVRLLLLLSPLWLVTACGERSTGNERPQAGDTMRASAQNGDRSLLHALPMDESDRVRRPAGTVRVGNDLYLVPLPAREGACRGYRLHSDSRMVLQALYFRRPDGAFTLNKADACG